MEIQIQTLAVGIIFTIIFFIVMKRSHIGSNEPPLVPYSIPVIGHTYNYLFDTKNFAKKCKEQYGDCFSIYVFGSVRTIVSGKFINEVFKSHNDFDLPLAARETFPLHKIFNYDEGPNNEKTNSHAKIIREQVSGKLDSNTPIVQKYLVKGIDKWIGNCDDPKEFNNAVLLINNIVALSVANIFVGEEAASHEDLVNSFANLATDLSPLSLIPPVFSFIHTKLHEFVVSLPIRFGWNPVSNHRKIVVNRLKPVIEKRLKEKIELGDNYKPYNDLLEYDMNQPDFDYNNLPNHVNDLFVMIFAAVAATSKATANALYDLAGRSECLNELYEEALTINKECNGSPTVSEIKKMKKLDSFIKESLRHSDDTLSFNHYMKSKSYTFSNGFTIPEGRMITMYVDDSLKSRDNFGDDAEEFKPFRFLNTDSPATKVDRAYIVFGGGRHACPGRFFAINKAKLILHNLILKYNISTKSGKIENKTIIGPLTSPSRSALVFENRQ